eukprot:CAMPEP_0167768584 /NCGR_PEP_ID=MMETSP0110_2-20121227/16757_1 /TAXON_ID=629695 /ORGANISM="Gymnochlora sp., Strain CCMP2014" /LENGTH=1673 /DNA_ID=CAMNT_0007657291 /DNA_START=6 /DNA_END=5025 /DNA_ORIENTATION=-
MSVLDDAAQLLAEHAMEDPYVKLLHTSSMHLKVGQHEMAYEVTSTNAGWDATKNKEAAKALKKRRGKQGKGIVRVASRCVDFPHEISGPLSPEGKTMSAADAKEEEKKSFIEDIQVIVGNHEHENVWGDYKPIPSTVAAAVSMPLRSMVNGKKLSICVRTAGEVAEVARRTPITGIALVSSTSPPPPLLERIGKSLSRRHPASLQPHFASRTFTEAEKESGVELDMSQGVMIHIARAGPGAPAMHHLGIVAVGKEELPPFSVGKEELPPFSGQILRTLEGSSANLQPNSGGQHLYLCWHQPMLSVFKKLRSLATEHKGVLEKSSSGVVALLTGMLLTSHPNIVAFALESAISVMKDAPQKVRETFAAQIAAQAPHLVGILDSKQRISAEEVMGQLAYGSNIGAVSTSLSLETRTRMGAATLLVQSQGITGRDPDTWTVIRATVVIYAEPISGSKPTGELVQGEEIIAFQKIGGWIQHSRGWSPAFLNNITYIVSAWNRRGSVDTDTTASSNPTVDSELKKSLTNTQQSTSHVSPPSVPHMSTFSRGPNNPVAVGSSTAKGPANRSSNKPLDKSPTKRKFQNSLQLSKVKSKGFHGMIARINRSLSDLQRKRGILTRRNESKFSPMDDILKDAIAVSDANRLSSKLESHSCLGFSFCDEATAAAKILPSDHDGLIQQAFSLALCLAKQAAVCFRFEASKEVSYESDDVPQSPDDIGIRCVQSLMKLLQAAAPIFASTSEGRALVRRTLLPLMGPLFSSEKLPLAHTKAAAALFLTLYREYKHIAKGEIAVFLTEGLFPRSYSKRESDATRTCLITLILDILRDTDGEAVTLFYNFDSNARSPGVSAELRGNRMSGVISKMIIALLRTACEGIDERKVSAAGGGVVVAAADARRTKRGSQRGVAPSAGLGAGGLEDSDTPHMQRTALACIWELVKQAADVGGINLVRDQKNVDRICLPGKKDHHSARARSSDSVDGLRIIPNLVGVIKKSKKSQVDEKSVSESPRANNMSVNIRISKIKEKVPEESEAKQSNKAEKTETKETKAKDSKHGNIKKKETNQTAASAVRSREKLSKLARFFEKALILAKNTYKLRHDPKTKDKSEKAVKSSVKFLMKNGVTDPRIIADFLFDNSHRTEYLPKDQIAEYLATGEEKKHVALRTAYSERVDLSHLDFVQALRLFLGDCGLLIVNLEAAKVVRMMRLFAEIYCRDNPQSPVKSVDGAHTLASMIMAIHTGLWNQKARKQNPPPSAKDFASFLRGSNTYQEDGKLKEANFPLTFLMRQYADIAREEIKTLNISGNTKVGGKRHGIMSLRSLRRLRTRFRRLDAPLGKLWSVRMLPQSGRTTVSKLMFEEIYGPVWRAVNSILHAYDKIDTTHMCLEIIAYGVLLALETELQTYYQGFLEILAEKIFVETELEKMVNAKGKTRSLRDRLLRQEHRHRQMWFKQANYIFKDGKINRHHRLRTIRQILVQVSMCKSKVRQRKETDALKTLQGYFGHKIYLMNTKRSFQKSAKLVKVSDRGQKKQKKQYTFFLFSDLLIYAAGNAPHFKVHQTLHLSLARIKDMKGTLRHQILSPQKSFSVEYPDAKTKRIWMELLLRNIEIQRMAHHKHTQAARGESERGSHRSERMQALTAPNSTRGESAVAASSGEYETDPGMTSSFFNVDYAPEIEKTRNAW